MKIKSDIKGLHWGVLLASLVLAGVLLNVVSMLNTKMSLVWPFAGTLLLFAVIAFGSFWLVSKAFKYKIDYTIALTNTLLLMIIIIVVNLLFPQVLGVGASFIKPIQQAILSSTQSMLGVQ